MQRQGEVGQVGRIRGIERQHLHAMALRDELGAALAHALHRSALPGIDR